MVEIKIITDGSRAGTTVILNGKQICIEHWKSVRWEFDLVNETAMIGVQYLPPAGWHGLSDPFRRVAMLEKGDLQVDIEALLVLQHPGDPSELRSEPKRA